MSERIKARFEVLDERFRVCNGDEWVQRLWTGGRWTEGPAYFAAGRYLVFSDIPNDRMLRWDEVTGTVGVFREPAGYTNGTPSTRPAGSSAASRAGDGSPGPSTTARSPFWPTATTACGSTVPTTSSSAATARCGSPTRPTASTATTRASAQRARSAPVTSTASTPAAVRCGAVRIVADDFERPNGLAFTPDEQLLYIVDTRRRHLRRFTVGADGSLGGGDVFGTCNAGSFDGVRVDDTGRVWVAAGDGLHCFDPDGTLIGKLLLPEVVANFTFGGRKRNDLFICASSSLYTLRVNFESHPSTSATLSATPASGMSTSS